MSDSIASRAAVCGARRRTHAKSQSREYRIWAGILTRCTNPNANGYQDYGGRGIRVCERWRVSFEAFLADMGPRPSPRHSVERTDHDGDYEPGNCQWIVRAAQNRNKRNSVILEHDGLSLPATEWAERLAMNYGVLLTRLARGWTPEKALTTPMKPRPNDRNRRGTERSIWLNIKYRCHHENCPDYPKYGGRGIRMCQRWRDSFEAFLQAMGPRPGPGYSVDRMDNDGDYCPENCRWATAKEQASNRRSSRLLTCGGVTKTLKQWAADLGVTSTAIRARLRQGQSESQALTTPFPRGSRQP